MSHDLRCKRMQLPKEPIGLHCGLGVVVSQADVHGFSELEQQIDRLHPQPVIWAHIDALSVMHDEFARAQCRRDRIQQTHQ